jgi:hypothetical protein
LKWQNLFKIQYLSHLRSKNYKFAFKKSHSSKVFQKYQDLTIIYFFSKIILLNFSFLNCSIFNNSYIVRLNIMKPPWCTPTHWKLSNITKSTIKGNMFWEISTWQTNKQLNEGDMCIISMTFSWHQIGRYKKTWDNIHVFIIMSCQWFPITKHSTQPHFGPKWPFSIPCLQSIVSMWNVMVCQYHSNGQLRI